MMNHHPGAPPEPRPPAPPLCPPATYSPFIYVLDVILDSIFSQFFSLQPPSLHPPCLPASLQTPSPSLPPSLEASPSLSLSLPPPFIILQDSYVLAHPPQTLDLLQLSSPMVQTR
eukprot:750307-Hanusia_phi.AAC.3